MPPRCSAAHPDFHLRLPISKDGVGWAARHAGAPEGRPGALPGPHAAHAALHRAPDDGGLQPGP